MSIAFASPFTKGNIIVATDDNQLYEMSRDGIVLQQFDIPWNSECCGHARDLLMTEDGNISIYNGTFSPVLSTLNTVENLWSDLSFPGWSTANNGSYGGIALIPPYVYVTDMDTGQGGEAKGIVRFDIQGADGQRFLETSDYIDISAGLDGKLYALQNVYGDLDVIDPASMTVIYSIDLGHTSGSRSVAVNAAGEIFMASWNGYINHYDNSGKLLNSLTLGSYNLSDIDLNDAGEIIIGSRFGEIFITDETLWTSSLITAEGGNVFTSFVNDAVPNISITVTPWQDNANGTLRTDINWNYALGYHFTPQIDGTVTGLGGLFSGTKYVRLFNKHTGELLAETEVTAVNDWAYESIVAVPVETGTTYTVAVYLAGSGGSYYYGNTPFPQTYGDIIIEGTTYAWTGVNPLARPTVTWTNYMLGQADIIFSPTNSD